MKIIKYLSLAVALTCSCIACKQEYQMGTYGWDIAFFERQNVEFLELKTQDGQSRLLIVPAYQGRVMTSTTAGFEGTSYGWINYKHIENGLTSPQFNPIGGEERFWIGPEGGPFSWYFKKGQEQVYENWVVPPVIDTEIYDIESQTEDKVVFIKDFSVTNASDVSFNIGLRRTIALVGDEELKSIGLDLPSDLKIIAYKTQNILTNKSNFEWTKETGLPSVWILSTFNPTPTTTVFIPYNKDCEGRIVNDEYFGKIPEDRLILDDGMLYFKIDGEYRSKLGLPAGSAKDICGSYDSEAGVLNILKYTVPEGPSNYVNGQWGPQENPFDGDVINSYNDGPTETGTIMGPFYEIETSSPGAELAVGESLEHTQYTIHIQGDKERLNEIAKTVFGLDLDKVAGMFNK